MADTCALYTVAGITINAATGDCLHTDFEEGEILGLDGAPIRRQIDPQGQSSGGLQHPAHFGPRIITFKGKVLVRSVDGSDRDAFAAAVYAVEAAAITALEGFLNSDTTLAWTPGSASARSISVRYGTEGGEFQTTGNMIDRRFQFSLYADNPTIS